MRQVLLSIFILGFVSAVSGQSINGIVREEGSARPLAYVSVFLPELKTGSATDSTGHFLIKGIPTGTFLMEVSLVGYATKVMRINSGENDIMVELALSVTEMQEIVVTGAVSYTERARNPIPVIPMKRDIMLQNLSTNLIDALTKQPGINQISTGPAIGKPVIRGLGYNRVVVLRNGMRQEGQQWGDEHGIEIDEYEVDRVEIIKGPGSLLYGSDAMAGVVNFLLPRPPAEGTARGEWLTTYQSNGNFIGNSLNYSGMKNGFSWLTRFSQKKSGNYQNRYDGYVLNSGFEEFNGSAQLGINRTWGFSNLQFSTFNQKLGLVEGERDSHGNFVKSIAEGDSVRTVSVSEDELKGYQNSSDVPYQRINHNRIVWSNNIFFGESNLLVNLGWQQNRRREFGEPLTPGQAGQHFLLNTYNADIKYFLRESNGWNVSVGLSGQSQNNRNLGTEFLIPAYQSTDGGVFGFVQKQKAQWLISGGLRYDFRHIHSEALYLDANGDISNAANAAVTRFKEFDRDFSALTGSAGFSFQFSNVTIGRFNISRGFRVPNLSELGSNGKHEGTFRYEVGNSNLNPETSMQVDLGITVSTRHLTVDASAFYNNIRDYIFLEKVLNKSGQDSIASPSDPAPVFKFVQGNAYLYGGELSVDVHPHPLDWLHFENSFSYVIGAQLNQPDSMRNLPFMPAPKFQSEIRLQPSRNYGRIKQPYFKIDASIFAAQNYIYEAYHTETRTPGYYLINLGTGCEFTDRNNNTMIRLFVTVSNLLDAGYQSHLSRLKYAPVNPATGIQGIYNAGRNISVKLVIPFGKQ